MHKRNRDFLLIINYYLSLYILPLFLTPFVNMKFTMILTTFLVAAVTATPADNELFGRKDCGKGGAPYTRRTNSKCGTGNGGHTYCGCDRAGIVSPPVPLSAGSRSSYAEQVKCVDNHWKEIKDCQALSGGQKCYGTGTGAHCGVALTPAGNGGGL